MEREGRLTTDRRDTCTEREGRLTEDRRDAWPETGMTLDY
jgi:hypothetical protein